MNPYLNQPVLVCLSGYPAPLKGRLIDIGSDVIVLYNGTSYLYVPLKHLQYLTQCPSNETDFDLGGAPEPDPIAELSYRKALSHARGTFLELFLSGRQPVHGYITSIMNDFFLFHSPMYKELYISMNHLKVLIPYGPGMTPYALKRENFPVMPSTSSLARTFEQQLRKAEGQFVVLDLGDSPGKNGVLQSVRDGLVEMVTADGSRAFLHLDHVQSMHRP